MFRLSKSEVFKLLAMFFTMFLFTIPCNAEDPISLGYITVSSDTTDNSNSSINNDIVGYSPPPKIVRTNLGDIGVIPRTVENKISLTNDNPNNVNVEKIESSDNNEEDNSYDINKGNSLQNSDYNSSLNQSNSDNNNLPSSDTLSNDSPSISSQNHSSGASSVSDNKSKSSNSKSAVIKTGENISCLLAITLGSLIISLFCILEQRKKFKISDLNGNLRFFCTMYTMIVRVMEKLRFYSQNKEVFSMFEFLKKSRAFKFLCSSCLVCSLGSFANVYAADPTEVGKTYVQGPLGFDDNTLVLKDTNLTADGKLSGTLKWQTTEGDENVFNSNEDTELVIFLKKDDSFVAVSKTIKPESTAKKGLVFNNVQLYKMNDTEATPLSDEENPGEAFVSRDGNYEIYGLVIDQGVKSIILSNESDYSDGSNG